MSPCGPKESIQLGTSHAVYFEGKFAVITVAHFNCSGIIPENYLVCPGVDISVRPICPVRFALNISTVAQLRDGDVAISYGFPVSSNTLPYTVGRSWIGRLTGKLGYAATGAHFNGPHDVHQVSDAAVFSATQLGGASGAGVLNTCGYLGIAHMSGLYNALCYVTPHVYVHACLRSLSRSLKDVDHCPDVEIINMPVSPSRQCQMASNLV